MPKSKGTAVLPGIEVPGHDDELTAAALSVAGAKEDAANARKVLEKRGEELLGAMREKKRRVYIDTDANVRVEIVEAKAKVKVLRKSEAKGKKARG